MASPERLVGRLLAAAVLAMPVPAARSTSRSLTPQAARRGRSDHGCLGLGAGRENTRHHGCGKAGEWGRSWEYSQSAGSQFREEPALGVRHRHSSGGCPTSPAPARVAGPARRTRQRRSKAQPLARTTICSRPDWAASESTSMGKLSTAAISRASSSSMIRPRRWATSKALPTSSAQMAGTLAMSCSNLSASRSTASLPSSGSSHANATELSRTKGIRSMLFVYQVTQVLSCIQQLAQPYPAAGEVRTDFANLCDRLLDPVAITRRDRNQFRHRLAVHRDDKSFTLLHLLQQPR